MSWGLAEGVFVGDEPPWMSDAERADAERVEREFARLAASVDPGDPWAHPEARRLDALSLGAWLREQRRAAGGAPPPRAGVAVAVLRRARADLAAGRAAQARDARRRRASTTSSSGRACASPRARRRWRCGWPPSSARGCGWARWCGAIEVSAGAACAVTLDDGEESQAEAVVCALPAGPLRAVEIDGPERRPAALAAAAAPRARGQGGRGLRALVLAGRGPERAGRDRVAVRLHLAAGRRACCRCWCRPSASRPFSPRPPDARRRPCSTGWPRCTASGRGGPWRCSSGLGGRSVHARLHHELGAGGPGSRRAAARDPRAAVLRGRLRPLGGGLHGGRGPDRRAPPERRSGGSLATRR